MKTRMHEIGVVDKTGNKHPVYFKSGLNVVTGKSSTGKSALIEIFDYCFGSSEYTVPQGVITKNATIYYVFMQINDQNIVIARDPKLPNKGFFKREDNFSPDIVQANYFESGHFIEIDKFKKHVTSLFVDMDDVDESAEARKKRHNNAKAATPSIRSFTSFMLQHQNLVANKHALFYRFDEKAKRDQVVEHTKIFLGLVDQEFFFISQEAERIQMDLNQAIKEQENARRVAITYSMKLGPLLEDLYAYMGVEQDDIPVTVSDMLRSPADAKDVLNKFLVEDKITHTSDASVVRYQELKKELNDKTAELRSHQRKKTSIKSHLTEEFRFVTRSQQLRVKESVVISNTICPFCHTHKDDLGHSANQLQMAINMISSNLASTKPIRAKFEAQLHSVQKEIDTTISQVNNIAGQIREFERSEKIIEQQKSLYEAIIMRKAQLFSMLDGINLADDVELQKRITGLQTELGEIKTKLRRYNVEEGLKKASSQVNDYMKDIGQHFEFEKSYRPINLQFSFETFDLYHQASDEKIYLRSMGSGANWMYCHVTLFLALHRYFAVLGDKCSIPTILFFDQPTQVYFPNFKRDEATSFNDVKETEQSQRSSNERPVDEDIQAVQNLFSRLSEYCIGLEEELGFSPQIIVTDHADELTLSNGVSFNSLVNENRWRTRGLIDPVPSAIENELSIS